MGLKNFSIQFSEISQDPYLRNDEKYYNFLNSSGWNLFNSKNSVLVPLKYILIDDYNLFKYEDDKEYYGIPTGQTYLDEDGYIIDFQPVTLDKHPARLKYRITNDNILISSLRLAKSPALNFEELDLSKYIFSNGFYIFKVNNGWNIRYILHVLRSKKLKNILDNHIYRGIGISAYKKEDLLRIRIPLIRREKQDKIATQIKPIESEINVLRAQIIPPQDVINTVFSREFEFDLDKVYGIEKIKYFNVANEFIFRNLNLRSSVRWNKILPIQKELYKNNPYIKKLGKYIIRTKNGWSPNCRETDTEYYVFNVNSISKNSIINYDNLKTSNENRKNIEGYFAREGDLFVSRGNTVDLVALASVVKDLPSDKNIIFPDLFIRIQLNENKLLNEYLAHLFNSIIGRLYFKYSAKGKNQTMVKVSADELINFYLPVPPILKQQKIIDEINTEFNKQNKLRNKIRTERNKIDEIIQRI